MPPTLKPSYRYRFTVERVIDGDTFVAKIDLGFDVWTVQHIRLLNYYAPESKSPDGPAARQALQAAMAGATELVLETTKDRTFTRYLGTVFVDSRPVIDLLPVWADKGIT